jgi:CheY-like chemotaxis protein
MDKTKPKVMIVDDNPVCRKQAETIAQKFCECVSVGNGEDAVTAFVDTFRKKERKFDAIILDFEMPFMNGIDVIIEIRKAEKKRKIEKKDQAKIIMMTSHNDRMTVHACKSVGCNHYIIKPLSSDGLQKKLRLCNLI